MGDPALQAKKIVLIECDTHFGSSIKAHLVKLGYDVEHVCRPCAVAHTLRTFRPDIVLTDQLAPGTEDGSLPHSLKQFNSDTSRFKLVLFSSACDEARAEMVRSGLVDGCLDKGMSLDKLRDAIESLYN